MLVSRCVKSVPKQGRSIYLCGVIAVKESRLCREHIIDDDPNSIPNCATCVKFDREAGRCKDEGGVIGRYEDTEVYDIYTRLMKHDAYTRGRGGIRQVRRGS